MELYNLRHASLRSKAIECAFGYTKEKFRILHQPLPFKSIQKQSLVIYNIFGLHNIIIEKEGGPAVMSESYQNSDSDDFLEDNHLTSFSGNQARDMIASQMWIQYLEYLNTN